MDRGVYGTGVKASGGFSLHTDIEIRRKAKGLNRGLGPSLTGEIFGKRIS